MTTPSKKSPELESFLEQLFGRTSAVTSDKCVEPPIGCGKQAIEFRDELSHREYTISGLCQQCQDEVFRS